MACTIQGPVPGIGILTGKQIVGLVEFARANAIRPDGDGYYWLSVSGQSWHRLRVQQAREAWRELYRGVRMARKAGARVRLLVNDQEVA